MIVWPCAAYGDDGASEGDAHIQRGVDLRRAGKNFEALAEFQQAYALVPTPRAQVQMALALQALGDWLGAERGLEEGLKTAADPWIAQYRSAIEGALATVRAHLGRLFVDVNVTEGELLLNGVSVHALPVSGSIRVISGDLDLEARARGYVPLHRSIHVEPGADVRETVSLELLTPAAAAPPASRSQESFSARASFSDQPRHKAGFVMLGAAFALGVGAVVAWRVQEDNAAIYNNDSRCLTGTLTRGQQCGRFASNAQVALGLEVGAAASAVVAAGIGGWLLWSTSGRPSGAAAVFCAPAGVLGVSCEGQF